MEKQSVLRQGLGLLGCLGAACLSAAVGAVSLPNRTAADTPPVRTIDFIDLDAAAVRQELHGIGSVFSYEKLFYDYPEKQRKEILDYLFLPGYGASLQLVKVEIGYDGNNTTSAWPSHRRSLDEAPNYRRGFVWWLMKEAKKRNPDIVLSGLHWGYPAYARTDDLKAEFIFEFVNGAKKVHGLDIDYIGGNQNESLITPEVTIRLRRLLDANGYGHVRIIAADEGARVKVFSVLQHLQENTAYADAVDVIGVHYKGRPASFMPESALTLGKYLWSSEDSGGSYANPNSGYQYADQLHKLLYQLPFNGVAGWLATSSAYDNMPWPNAGFIKAKDPWSGYYEISPHLWAIAHYTQFTKAGWNVLHPEDANLYAEGKPCGNFLAFAGPQREDYTVVFNTYAADFPEAGVDVVLQAPSMNGKPFQMWTSDFTKGQASWFVKQVPVTALNGSYRVHLAKNCLYTLSTFASTQRKGTAQPPKNHGFPLPYGDDFDHYPKEAMPAYFIDANGAFEVVPSAQTGRGNVLRQVVHEAPTLWHWRSLPPAQPVTQIGDLSWKDYRVTTDVLLESAGTFCLGGRFDGKKENNGDYLMEGYWLFIDAQGRWKLLRRDGLAGEAHKHEFTRLASGVYTGITPDSWFNVALELNGKRITAYCNGTKIVDVEDDVHRNGSVALGSLSPDAVSFFDVTPYYTAVQLDNFRIQPIK